jgi:LuxR family maltose regulon positive regulatory protein
VFERLQDGSEFGMALAVGPELLWQLAGAAWGERLSERHQQTLREWTLSAQVLRGMALTTQAPAARRTTNTATGGLQDEQLTPREFEVLQRIAIGDSNKLIARTFELSPHTVKRHVANILDKLGVSTRGQAAAWARDHA